MTNDWIIKNKELIPPEHCLSPTPEAQKWMQDLGNAGNVYELTGDISFLKQQILVGMKEGFISETIDYKDNKIIVEYQIPRQLNEDGEREQNWVFQKLHNIWFVKDAIALVTSFFGIVAAMLFMWGLSLALVIYFLS